MLRIIYSFDQNPGHWIINKRVNKHFQKEDLIYKYVVTTSRLPMFEMLLKDLRNLKYVRFEGYEYVSNIPTRECKGHRDYWGYWLEYMRYREHRVPFFNSGLAYSN